MKPKGATRLAKRRRERRKWPRRSVAAVALCGRDEQRTTCCAIVDLGCGGVLLRSSRDSGFVVGDKLWVDIVSPGCEVSRAVRGRVVRTHSGPVPHIAVAFERRSRLDGRWVRTLARRDTRAGAGREAAPFFASTAGLG